MTPFVVASLDVVIVKPYSQHIWITVTTLLSTQTSVAENLVSAVCRITVYGVLEYLASDMTEAEILEDFPD